MKIIINYLLCFLLFSLCYSSHAIAGVWVNVETIKLNNIDRDMDAILSWLDQQKTDNTNKPNPWVGIKLTLTWNELWDNRPG